MLKDTGQYVYYCIAGNFDVLQEYTARSSEATITIEENYEKNDTVADANYKPFSVIDHIVTINGLSAANNDDYYAFTLAGTGDATSMITLTFTNRVSDLDIRLLDSAGNPVKDASGNDRKSISKGSDVEEISLEGLAAGSYRIRVENYGRQTNSYVLTVSPPDSPVNPTITGQPATPATYYEGETAIPLAVTAEAKVNGVERGTLSYQWYENTIDKNTGGTAISDATSKTFTPLILKPQGSAETKFYYCVVTDTVANGDHKVTASGTVTITVLTNPTVPVVNVTPAEPISIVDGFDTAPAITASATSNGTLTYQWYKSVENKNSGGAEVFDATENTYTPPNLPVGTHYYYCVVINSLNGKSESTASNVITLEVLTAPIVPVITAQPQDVISWNGDNTAQLSVTATGNGTLSYKWYSTASPSTLLSTSQTYTPPVSTAGEQSYFCIVSNSLNGKSRDTQSAAATVTVIGITEQTEGGIYGTNEAATLSVTMAGAGKSGVKVEYTWRQQHGVGNWGPLSGGSNRTYTPPTNNPGTAEYRCDVTVTYNGRAETFSGNIVTVHVQSTKLTDRDYEEIARTYIYDDNFVGDKPYAGWTVTNIFGDDEDYKGLYAEGWTSTDGESLLVFRGSDADFNSSVSNALTSALDWIGNLNSKGVGYDQYMAARTALIGWAVDAVTGGSSLSVIGHSLGGALAQWFAADFTSRPENYTLDKVMTFNSPGIARNRLNGAEVAASMFNANRVTNGVTHHITNGDIVSMFGDEYIAGKVYIHTLDETGIAPKDIISARHTGYLKDMSSTKDPITAAELSSYFFHYDGKDYLATIASLSTANPALTPAAPLLFFRGTAEGARSAIGKLVADKLVLTSSSITIPSIKLGSAGWELQNVGIAWNNSSNSFIVSAGLRPGKDAPTFGVKLGFVDYAPYIDSIAAYMDSNNMKLGATPLYLQYIDAGIYKIADFDNLTFAGNAEFTIGPKVSGQSLVTINGGIVVDKNHLAINGTVVAINAGLFQADGYLEYNWAQQYLKGNVRAVLLDNLVTDTPTEKRGVAVLNAALKIWNNGGTLTTVIAADAAVYVPSFIPLLGGWQIAKTGVGLYVTSNGTNSDDYVLVATSFDFFTNDGAWWKWSWKNDIGFKYYFNGNWELIGGSLKDIEYLKNLARSASAPPFGAAAAAAPAGVLENPNLLSLEWGQVNEAPHITFQFSDGRILTEAEMFANGYIKLFDELTSDTRRVYAVQEFSDLEIAQWEYTLDGVAGAITPQLFGLYDNLGVTTNAVSGGNGSPYQFDVSILSGESNASPNTKLTFYLNDTDYLNEDGEPVFNGVPVWETTLGELQTGSGWTPPQDLAFGTYSVYVVAEDGNKVPVQMYFADTITIAPVTPTGFQVADTPTTNSITLRWTAVEDVTYTLDISTDGSTWNPVENPAPTGTTVNDLTANTLYKFRLKATKDGLDSDYATVEATTLDDTPPVQPPATPTDLTAGVITETSVALSWTAVDGATSYALQYKTDDGDWADIPEDQITITDTSAIVTGLTAETEYQFRVNATNSDGSSAYSTVVTATTLPNIPPATPAMPTDFVAGTITETSVMLSWTAVTGADSYVVQYKTETGTFVAIPPEQVTFTGTSSATVTGLTAGTTYYFQIAAKNAGGESQVAATNATTNSSDTSKQQPPNNVKVDVTKGKETKSATITWTAPEGATGKTVYVIQYRIVGTTKWKKVTVKGSNKAGLTKDLKLKAGVTYEFQIFVKGVKKGPADSSAIAAGRVRAWGVIPSASLATIKSGVTQNKVTLHVKNYLPDTIAIGKASKNVVVDTLTVTYTTGKTKAEKANNLKTVTLKYDAETKEWIPDGLNIVFKDGKIEIDDLTAKTKYTVTALFSNEKAGEEATSAKATSKAVSTAK
ncbi:hypothetical protein FACS1894170_09940 [Planctomycetales bacterium]|nr:hypothetical protein FACS1894170_09940 [Planctomycetales bacterium]